MPLKLGATFGALATAVQLWGRLATSVPLSEALATSVQLSGLANSEPLSGALANSEPLSGAFDNFRGRLMLLDFKLHPHCTFGYLQAPNNEQTSVRNIEAGT